MNLENREYFAKGKRGIIDIATLDGRKVIIKKPNPRAAVDTIEKEAEVLAAINPHGIGPKLVAYTEEGLIREFVDGEELLDWAADATKAQLQGVILDVLRQCRVLDTLGMSKQEMTRPYKHILIVDGAPVQIDFERASRTEKPQNVTQACQWLMNSRMTSMMKDKGITLNKKEIIASAKAYKDTYKEEKFNAILAIVEEA